MKKYTVSNECIGCRACIEVADNNFSLDDANKAYLKKQPETPMESEQCERALDICPVEAITLDSDNKSSAIFPVLAKANIKETLDKHPTLKPILVDLSPKFKKLQTPVLYNTVARFADFNDAAKVTGVSICEILHTINKHLGVEEKLLKTMPECANQIGHIYDGISQPITWKESFERYIYNNDTLEELAQKISHLKPQENIVIISVDRPSELMKLARGLGFVYNVEEGLDYRISIFNSADESVRIPWMDRRDDFEVLDVRTMKTDPFDIIIKKSYQIAEGSGFVLVQKFEPVPMINMLEEMGFEHHTEEKGPLENWIYFHKKTLKTKKKNQKSIDKIDVVIQSATPVAYPVIMRLLQSETLRKHFNIKELKVWEETEKHLAWITNGKADISFSALITAAKLRNSDIKIPALFVWDNFVLLSRSQISNLGDVKGKDIYTPLFEEAPPAKITNYLIKAGGLNPKDFNLVFGKPFGRPEEIYADFVTGKADTVILREPEASYAIKIMKDRNEDISILSFNKMWNEINPGFGSFPNAGLVLKGEFARKYPKQAKIFLEELETAINWVNNNKKDAANLSFDMMRQPTDRVELFLNRVNFNYVQGEKLVTKVRQYFEILNKNNIVSMNLDKDFFNIFR